MRLIHVFVDNASYHKADIVKEWLAQAGRKIVLHFLPPYCGAPLRPTEDVSHFELNSANAVQRFIDKNTLGCHGGCLRSRL